MDYGFTLGEISSEKSSGALVELFSDDIQCITLSNESGEKTVDGVTEKYSNKSTISIVSFFGDVYMETADESTEYPEGYGYLNVFFYGYDWFDNDGDEQAIVSMSSSYPLSMDISAESYYSNLSASVLVDFENADVFSFVN